MNGIMTGIRSKGSLLRAAETDRRCYPPNGTRSGRLVITLIAALLMCPLGMSAQVFYTDGDWKYTVAAGVATLTGYYGSATEATTPASVGGYTVRAIAGNFNTKNLTSITVSEGVTEIQQQAFYRCSGLTNVNLPTTLASLGAYAFYGCSSLSDINLPSGLTHINEHMFQDCSSLESITIPSTVTVIGTWAFANCSSLSSITIPAGVTLIEASTFVNCSSLSSVTILGNVTTIQNNAFQRCENLTNISLPASVYQIGNLAFGNSGLTAVWFNGSKAQWNNVDVNANAFYKISPTFHWRCTTTFDMQGHGAAPAAQIVYSGVADALTVPTAPTATGYDFGGWYSDAACTEAFDFTAELDDNVTVYAKWTALENTIQFDLGGRGTAIDAQTVYSGNTVTEPDAQFNGADGIEGWYTDEERTQKYDFTTTVDHSMTLYAKWAAAGTATITTNGEGGTATLTNAKGQTFNDGKVMPGVYTLTVTPSSGYSFSGSYTLTERSGGASDMPYAFNGSSVKSYNIDLTAKDAAIEVTFSTQPILTVTTRADDASVLSGVTWSVVNNETSAEIENGGAIPYDDGTNMALPANFGIRLTVNLGSLDGYAFTATINDRGNGTTTYKNSNDGTSFQIVPHGSIDIDLYVYQPQTMALEDDGSNIDAITALNGDVVSMTLKRGFAAGKKQTLCLPFAPTALTSIGTVWEFTDISEGKAVMTQRTSGLKANTPYIFEPTDDIDAATGINFGTVAINYNADPKTVKSSKNFTFHGTYAEKTWEADDAVAANIYGFMMQDNDGQQTGQFVKARRRTVLRPFSCWLEYNGELTDTDPSSSAPLRAGTRAGAVELPDVIEIVWMSGDGIQGTTGMMDTRTGEIYEDDSWYGIDGGKLNGKPVRTGLYINKGKRVYITVE